LVEGLRVLQPAQQGSAGATRALGVRSRGVILIGIRANPDVGATHAWDDIDMQKIKEAATEFLSHRRIAVTGVSRDPKTHGANIVYQRLRERGYKVFPVNPNADEVEGDHAYDDLRSIPGGVEAVVIGTSPEHAQETMRECAELDIAHVWMHRGPGGGSVSPEAADYGRQHGIAVIDGGCPCMFGPTADPGHKMMRGILKITGNVPRKV
jgi:predicted CoA-binding protein